MMISTVAAGGPDRSTASQTLRQDVAGDRQSAWQKEMEREQLQTWLKHPLLPDSEATSRDAGEANPVLFPVVGLARIAAVPTDPNEVAHTQSRDAETGDDVDSVEAKGRSEPTAGIDEQFAESDMGEINGMTLENSGFAKESALPSFSEVFSTRSGAAERLVTVSQGLQQLLKDSGLVPLQLTVGNTGFSAMTPTAKEGAGLPASLANRLDDMGEEGLESLEDKSASMTELVTADNVPLRLHTEANGNVAKIWIGADGSVQLNDEKLQQLGSDIQRLLNQSGMILAALTFNGTVLMRAAPGLAGDDREEVLHDPARTTSPAINESMAAKNASLRSRRS